MIHIELKTPMYKLVLSKTDAVAFCFFVLNTFMYQTPNKLSDLASVFLYNKLRNKLHQNKIALKIPAEYAILLRTYCIINHPEDDLQRIALYNIFEQLDKKMK